MEQHRKKMPATNETRNLADERLTEGVLARFEDSKSPRYREIMQSLVKHLHAFVGEVKLTEEEWFEGMDFLTRTGQISNDDRQEFILLSDVLGVSNLIIGINNRKPAAATESTVLGPFFVEGSPHFTNGDDIANGAPGEPCYMQGRVLSVSGEPIPNARIEVWQADDEGRYDVQYDDLDEARVVVTSTPTMRGATAFGRSGLRRTRSRTTGRWGSYWARRTAARCARRTSTS
jgi:hydroxyquinol 1,2-dioxygenase